MASSLIQTLSKRSSLNPRSCHQIWWSYRLAQQLANIKLLVVLHCHRRIIWSSRSLEKYSLFQTILWLWNRSEVKLPQNQVRVEIQHSRSVFRWTYYSVLRHFLKLTRNWPPKMTPSSSGSWQSLHLNSYTKTSPMITQTQKSLSLITKCAKLSQT